MAGMVLKGDIHLLFPWGMGGRGQKVNPVTAWQTITTQFGTDNYVLHTSIFHLHHHPKESNLGRFQQLQQRLYRKILSSSKILRCILKFGVKLIEIWLTTARNSPPKKSRSTAQFHRPPLTAKTITDLLGLF